MIYVFNRSWVDTWWQQYITYLHTNSTHTTEKGKFGKCGPYPIFASYTLAFALQLRKKHNESKEQKLCFIIKSNYSVQITLVWKSKRSFLKCCIWSVALYWAETWTLGENKERVKNALETFCWGGMLKIKWTDRMMNDEVI
jgi:hypothetical protein